MKKKICVCLGIIFTIILVIFYGYVYFFKKSPVSIEDYISVMNQARINVIDETNKIDDNTKQYIEKFAYYDGEECETRFAEYKNSLDASLAFNKVLNNILSQAATTKEMGNKLFKFKYSHSKVTNEVSLQNKHYKYNSFQLGNGYYVIAQVENTLFYIASDKSNKDNIKIVLNRLHYNPEGLAIVLFSYGAALLFSAVLVCFCLAFIFKSFNVKPFIAFIPFANTFYLCKIADKSGWKILLFLIPFFNFFYYFIVMYKLAKRYTDSKSICFGMGFLPLVLLPVIAFNEPKTEEKQKNIYEEILNENETVQKG